jgi:hypothetical protein
MHSIKNISERNKIDTQSRADAYIKRKRLIIMSDYNLKHPKVFLKLKKTLKTLSPGQIYIKNPKKNKKTHWGGFFFLNPGFFPTLPSAGVGLAATDFRMNESTGSVSAGVPWSGQAV